MRNFIVEAICDKELRLKVWEEVHSAYMQMPSRKDEIYASSPEKMDISNFHIFGYTGPVTYNQLSKKKKDEVWSC